MNLNELQLWHRHHQELIRKAYNGRLVRSCARSTRRGGPFGLATCEGWWVWDRL
jgi:hypothetical protein